MVTDTDLKTYKTYRAALRKQTAATRANGSRDSRASQRRNDARKITVDRHNVSFAEVKRIVAEYDVLFGIEHPHTEQYLQDLEHKARHDEHQKNPVPCACGSTELVRVRRLSVGAEVEYRALCFLCFRETPDYKLNFR